MTDSDEALVGRAQRGERAAFEELLRRTSRLVFARLYLETGDTHQAEDLVQETYLLAFRSLASLTDPKAFRTWLLSLAHNAAIDAVRRSLRKKRSGGPQVGHEALAEVASGTPEPVEQAAQNELRGRVLAVLRSLPEEYRLPLTLRYIGGADYDSIRTQLGLTNGSLRGLLHRGLKLLRDRLPTELGETATYPRALQQE
jgi:RNA polymerase sigma-70 factor (ECF subfamily)